MRRFLAVLAVIAAALVGATISSANIGSVAISCDAVTFSFDHFPTGPTTVSWSVTVDGSAQSGSSGIGPSATITVPLRLHGSHTVSASSSWTLAGSHTANGSASLVCPDLPPPPPPKGEGPCPDGGPHNAGHDGQPGNDDCARTPPSDIPTPPPVVVPPPQAVPVLKPKPKSKPHVSRSQPHPNKPKPKPHHKKLVCKKGYRIYKGHCHYIARGSG